MSFASNYLEKKPFDTLGWDDVMNGKKNTPTLHDKAEFTLADLQASFGAGEKQILWPDHCIA